MVEGQDGIRDVVRDRARSGAYYGMRNDHAVTLTVEQAAAVPGIGRSTAYELVHTGDIPSLRLGRRLVVPTAALADALGVSVAVSHATTNPSSRLQARATTAGAP